MKAVLRSATSIGTATAVGPALEEAGTSARVLTEVAAPRELSADGSHGGAAEARGLPAGVGLLGRLEGICAGRGLESLASRLDDMVSFVGLDLASFEAEFAALPRRDALVGLAGGHLLDLGGKRLRPMCLSLAARLGSGFDPRVLDLAVAVELVHSATLLHDDVVDLADTRRGEPAARSIYGNAASIFAGDWLLVEALRRVRRAGIPGLLDGLLDTIEEMIFAESIQLENRGRIDLGRDGYFNVVVGKTASVFRWAMTAGSRAGGLDDRAQTALAAFGEHLGITFQAVDDLLDFTGDAGRTGKRLFADLREGKMTLPLILALERADDLEPTVRRIVELPGEEEVPAELADRVVDALVATGANEDTLSIARDHSARAIANLRSVPDSRARRALETVAETIVDRDL
ncbi:MAG: polyprenyl synthetase family protein [Acidobacteriota bacterium]